MATYVNISRQEMKTFLESKGFREVNIASKEMVLGKIVKKNICVRIYTGIVGNVSRGAGKDAIRVGVFYRNTDGRIIKIGGSKRVHRVEGWKNNLSERLAKWNEQLYPTCNRCGMPSIERINKKDKTKFLGCSQYPNCKATRPLLKTVASNTCGEP